MLLIRCLLGLAGLGVLLQADCSNFLELTGCLPEYDKLFGPQDGDPTPSPNTPIILEPTTKTTTSGVFLRVENNTVYNIEVRFQADDRVLIARVAVGASPTYEVAPPESTTAVTAGTIDLNGSWVDQIENQTLTFVGSSLDQFIDETGLVHVFSQADVLAGLNVLSQGVVERRTTENLIALQITTQSTDITSTATEIREYQLIPSVTGTVMTGASVVAQVDALGNITTETLIHSFLKRFPTKLAAISEVDMDPQTGQVVQEFTYDQPDAEVEAGVDYDFGQTITFRINSATVSYVVSG